MDKHITNKILASYIADTLPQSERDRIQEHIIRCGPCRKRHERMVAAIAPLYSSLMPGDRVKEKILRSWKEIYDGDVNAEPGVVRSLLERRRRAAIASAIGAVAAIIVVAVIIIQAPWETGRASLTMNRMDAGVTVNDQAAHIGDPVYEASRIKLPERAMARLEHGNILNITLLDKTDFVIDRLSIGKNSRMKLNATLRDGMLVSAIHVMKRSVAYEYMTPNARIEPLGTEFLLQVYAGVTLVIMKEGVVKATNVRSGKIVTVRAGQKCVISDSMLVMPTEQEDLDMFGDLDKVRQGAYARLLLPAVYAPASSAQAGNRNNRDAVNHTSNLRNDDRKNNAASTGDEHIKRQDEREGRVREWRQQRMDQKKLQMNEMRRTNRTNLNQQMRKGR